MRIHVAVGAGYGDEGKGLMTDYFCSQYKPNEVINIKVNGGCQAGHTACVMDKREHRYNLNVFHTIGAGTLRGVNTFLASRFVFNFRYLAEELEKFERGFGFRPFVLVSEQCRVQFRVDEALNIKIEEARSNKHGTCGKGVYETVNRHHQNLGIRVYEVYDRYVNNERDRLLETIVSKSLKYIEYRKEFILKSEGLDIDIEEIKSNIYEYANKTIDDIWYLIDNHGDRVITTTFDKIVKQGNYKALVFECSQGLELNWGDPRNTPHTTASHTGITNVIKELKTLRSLDSIDSIEVCYITRSYKTKHGAGYFPELDDSIVEQWQLYDRTNQPNKHQGTLAYGTIDRERMAELINNDFKQIDTLNINNITKSLAVTHLDQTNEAVLEKDGVTFFKDFNAKQIISGDKTYYSFGEKATDIIVE